jgi:prepilin-type N-terminal cleavage/methylation domain-containing protein
VGRRDRTRRAAGTAGFTLVELLVALTIVGLVTGFALQSLSGALARLAGSGEAARATLLARSTLARVGHDIALGGEASGRTGDGYVWSVASAPYTAIAVPAQTGVAGYTVRVTVGWRQRGRARQVELSTVRLAYRSPSS